MVNVPRDQSFAYSKTSEFVIFIFIVFQNCKRADHIFSERAMVFGFKTFGIAKNLGSEGRKISSAISYPDNIVVLANQGTKFYLPFCLLVENN